MDEGWRDGGWRMDGWKKLLCFIASCEVIGPMNGFSANLARSTWSGRHHCSTTEAGRAGWKKVA